MEDSFRSWALNRYASSTVKNMRYRLNTLEEIKSYGIVSIVGVIRVC